MHSGFLEELESGCPLRDAMISNLMPHETEKVLSKPLEASGNKGFGVVGGKCDDCLGYGGYNLHDGFEGRKVCPTCNGDGATKEDVEDSDTFGVLDCNHCNGTGFIIVGGEFEKAMQWQFDRIANIGKGITPDDVTESFADIRTAHEADTNALRDQLASSTKLIEMQARRIAELNQQVAELADIAKELSTELDVFAHTRGDDLSLIRLTQTADIIIAKAKGDPIPDFGVDTVYPCDACCDGYAKVGDCCNECGVVLVLPGRAI